MAPVLGLGLVAESLGVRVHKERHISQHGARLDVGQQQVGLGDGLLDDAVGNPLSTNAK